MHLRSVSFADKSRRLNSLYRVKDPWGMETACEQSRFAATAAIIDRWVGTVGTLLEVGCGEGHQSMSLLSRCQTLVGIDISERAIARARSRCSGATFFVGDIYSTNGPAGNRFDLVTACEVLYYMSDPRAAILRMSEIGEHCIATYYHGRAATLDSIFRKVPIARSEEFRHGDTRWRAVYWRGDDLLLFRAALSDSSASKTRVP